MIGIMKDLAAPDVLYYLRMDYGFSHHKTPAAADE
jgi:hypothetical protein